ncbi:M1 family metallopeptidase [Acidicapsa dinghuensis]|uniref:Aminopeptidase N n=1 Tax=Acidicapsa dinghuensis TaxID=2218256 RepID=A0ABW1EHJ9_9BACT|nr:M1 family aminopeptidase [Acidicapsa dinghuensis]
MPNQTCIRILFVTVFLLTVPALIFAQAEPGVSRSLAKERAQRISNIRYDLVFTLKEHADTVAGTATVEFDSESAGDLLIDYRDGALHSAVFNGQPISTQLDHGHLHLPAQAGHNILKAEFSSNAAPAGKAITRYEDKDDGSEYFYTLFVPMDASMAFPCFDQPDLKAQFTLSVEHPDGWTVIGNTTARRIDGAHTRFDASRKISTYLFAFAAGPFAAIPAKIAAGPTIYVRKSQLQRAEQEAPQVQSIAARGVGYLSSFFAQPFPFPKYDLVLIPGFPFGGMEHAGETFLNEDSVLFRTAPTPSDYFRRNTLILHETCHQWFGDLVTMRWFDDLWLKEGFAQYMAYKALADLEPASDPWKHFYQDIKPAAYGIDETLGTTPIYQSIPNLKDAKSAYGAIVYQKAPAVLKQLEFHVGSEVFRNGLRLYLKQHAYANAEWNDLIKALEQAGSSLHSNNAADLESWAQAWIQHRGMPEVNVAWSCEGGKLSTLTLSQQDVLPDGYTWPISNLVDLHFKSAAQSNNKQIRVDWNTPTTSITEAVGQPCPVFIFANAGDQAYGRFLLDEKSEKAAATEIVDTPVTQQDPLLRSMLWGALWDNVHLAQSSPRSFVDHAMAALPHEPDEAMTRVQSARITTVLHSYLSEEARKSTVPNIENVVADRMLHAPDLALRIVSFRAFTNIAETPQALDTLKKLLQGQITIPGMPLKPLDRWNIIGHLLLMNDPDAQSIYSTEKEKDHSGEGQKYAYAVASGVPGAAVKARYFEQYLHDASIQEDWITQSLRPFNAWNQSALTQPYLAKALDSLEEIKQHRKIFFLGAWLSTFMDGQNTLVASNAAQLQVHQWLQSRAIDADLRLKVLEAVDELERTARIQQKFPD